MAGPGRRQPQAGGAMLAGAILVGTAAGVATGQPSFGFLAGLGAGLLLLAAVWLLNR